MSDLTCKECKKLFTEEGINRVKRTKICGKCHYQKQVIRDLKNALKNSGITEQVCNKCGILKPIKEYKKGHKKCKQCPIKKRKPLDYTNLFCKDCGEKLTPETKTSGKRQCKYCTNLYQRNRVKKAKESGVTKKTCRKCETDKPIKEFRDIFHHECMRCDQDNRTKYTEEEFLSRNPHIKEKTCIICKETRNIKRFSFHTTNYRNQCKNCLNKLKRYIQTRLRKIERVGITAYRKHNTLTHSKWILNNYEQWKAYCDVYINSPEGRCSMHFSCAKRRNLIDKGMNAKEFKKMALHFINKPCYYCNRPTTPGSVQHMIIGNYNGIDRIDSKKPYSYDNCVSCCTHCNIMKNSADIASFIRKCCEISNHNNLVDVDVNTDYRLKLHNKVKLVGRSSNYIKYKETARQKRLVFKLSKEIFYNISRLPCYLCGKSGKGGIGIDRFDNNIGYLLENSKPCCNYCNYMKNKWDYNLFLNKVKEIVNCTSNKECLKELCYKADINYISSGKVLPYENDTNDIQKLLL